MKLIWQLVGVGGGRVLAIAALGLASGFVSTGFIALINRVLHNDKSTSIYLLVILFVCLAVARLTTKLWAQWMMVRFAQDKLLSLCEELCKRVVQTPFLTIERIGPARILATLSDDVTILSASIQAIPSIAGNAAVLIGCLIYLAYLSWVASIIMFIMTATGAIIYKLLIKKAYKAILDARAGRDMMFRHFRSLTEGIKEIKMSTERQNLMIEEEIDGTARYLRKQNLIAMLGYLKADGWAQVMFYLVMGLLLFALPALNDISLATLTGYAFVALYAMAPVWGIMGSIPKLQRGKAALDRIDGLGFSLASGEQLQSESCKTQFSGCKTQAGVKVNTPKIELKGIRFSYRIEENSQENFILGPINLTLLPGKIIFIIGGNGSGKTTLLKLLTGLYAADSGEILVEGQLVPHDSQSYRQLFSVVFSDYYIFDRLQNSSGSDPDRRANKLLKLLQLDKKVRVMNGVYSTTSLSQGQRRRLALLSAYLEDRPVYVFDEWAADQDPAYKEVFYTNLIMKLKNRGKTVIVITHDDRYFRYGDTIIKLDYGKIVDSWSLGDLEASNTELIGMVSAR